MVTIVNIRTGAKVEVSEPAARRRLASGRWIEEVSVPSESDRKAAWVDHAVDRGVARDDAEAMTKAELVAQFGA